MSFLDCLKGQVGSKKLMAEVTEQYDALMAKYGNDESIVAPKLAEWWKESSGAFKEQRIKHAVATDRMRTHATAMVKADKAEYEKMSPFGKHMYKMFGKTPSYSNAVEDMLLQADYSALNGANELLGQLQIVHDRLSPKGITFTTDGAAMRKVVEGMLDGLDRVDDSTLRGASKEFATLFQRALEGYQAQGGILGNIQKYAPIKHNALKIGEATEVKWVAAYSAMVDRSAVLNSLGKPVNDAEWARITSNMYQDITTNNASRIGRQMEKHGKEVSRYTTDGAFARRNHSRLANPKNAAAYLEYNKLFGVGDEGLYDVFVSSLEGVGRDTGIMKYMGPLPEDATAFLRSTAAIEGAAKNKLDRIDGLFRTLTGSWDGSVDNIWTRGASAMQGFMSSNLLGSASIAALADTALMASAKRLNGISGVNTSSEWIRGLTNPRDQLRALHIAEKISHVSVSRFDGSISLDAMGKTGQFANNLKNLNHRVSGLERITQATGDVLTMSFFADLGKYADDGMQFNGLNPAFSKLLRRHMVSESDWNRLMKVGADEDGFIRPQMLPENMQDIAFKLDNLNAELRLFATNSPDLKTRYWSTGNFAGERTRGDVTHMLSSAVMQFKSFPIQVWRNHFVPSAMRAAQGDVMPLGLLMMQSAFMGGIVVQTKELLKGKPMYDLENQTGEFIMKSMWQAGFAGLIGDVIFKDPDGYRRNVVQEFAGPGISVTADTALAFMSTMKAAFSADEDVDYNLLRRSAMPFVPLGTLWYTKLAVDRMVLDTLNAAGDDGFYDTVNRRNKKLEDERGASGWWASGDSRPGG